MKKSSLLNVIPDCAVVVSISGERREKEPKQKSRRQKSTSLRAARTSFIFFDLLFDFLIHTKIQLSVVRDSIQSNDPLSHSKQHSDGGEEAEEEEEREEAALRVSADAAVAIDDMASAKRNRYNR